MTSQITAQKHIGANSEAILKAFTQISKNPKLYQMDTHEGIFLLKGNLDKTGSIFETRETFLGITLKLKFEVTKVNRPKEFIFRLIRPLGFLHIKGGFFIKQTGENAAILSLRIFQASNVNLLQKLLALSIFILPTRFIIKKQITKEVELINNIIKKLK
jgi:hypothetical protein